MTYELPFGKGRKFMNHGGVLNAMLGGWDLAYTQTLQSGPPFTCRLLRAVLTTICRQLRGRIWFPA